MSQRFIDHLVLQQKAARTILAYTAWIYDLAKFTRCSPDLLTLVGVRPGILHRLTERKPGGTSINLDPQSRGGAWSDIRRTPD